MSALVIFIVLFVACFAAVAVPDHRDLDDRDRRGWWPGVRRR
jgi:hypothetical protein